MAQETPLSFKSLTTRIVQFTCVSYPIRLMVPSSSYIRQRKQVFPSSQFAVELRSISSTGWIWQLKQACRAPCWMMWTVSEGCWMMWNKSSLSYGIRTTMLYKLFVRARLFMGLHATSLSLQSCAREIQKALKLVPPLPRNFCLNAGYWQMLPWLSV